MTAKEIIHYINNIRGKENEQADYCYNRFLAMVNNISNAEMALLETNPAEVMVRIVMGWNFKPDSRVEGVDLVRVLKFKEGNCIELSLLYLLLGQEIDIKVNTVLVPNHMFIRIWQGGRHVNVEPMYLETYFTDEELIDRYSITKNQLCNGIYMSNLTVQETLSIITHKIKFELLASGRAIDLPTRHILRKAKNDYPKGIDLYNSLAINCLKRKRYYWGERWLRHGLEIDEDSMFIAGNLIFALTAQGKNKETVLICEEAIKKFPLSKYPTLLRHLAIAYCKIGEYDLAEKSFSKLQDVVDMLDLPIRNQFILPYKACLYYWLGKYEDSAKNALEWAKVSTEFEVCFLWAANAYKRMGMQDEACDVIVRVEFSDEFISCLGKLICGTLNIEKIVSNFSERMPEIECYLGEYWAPINMNKALAHWKKSIDYGKVETFEYLRALRNYADNIP